jgi:hypothetical protein
MPSPSSPASPASPTSPADVPTVTALVPLRTGGKSRLGDALDASSRAGLVLAMLDDVVAALHGAGVTDVRLLAGGDDALAAAHARGLPAYPDPRPTGDGAATGDVLLRRAVDAGLAVVPSDRDRLVVAGDLPLLSAAEVTMVLDVPPTSWSSRPRAVGRRCSGSRRVSISARSRARGTGPDRPTHTSRSRAVQDAP